MKDDEADVGVVNGITHMLKCYPKDVIKEAAELAVKGDDLSICKAMSIIALRCKTVIFMKGHATEKDFAKSASRHFAFLKVRGKDPYDYVVVYYNKDTKWIDNVIFYDGPSTDEDEDQGDDINV